MPICGILQPKSEAALVYDPPLEEDEQPVVLSLHTGEILLREQHGMIVIVNTTNVMVPYLAYAASRSIIRLLQTPISDVMNAITMATSSPEALKRAAQAFGGKVLETVLGKKNKP